MKITVWTVASCYPEHVTCKPSFTAIFASEAEAVAHLEREMRSEWEINAPEDEETGEKLPYPGGWQEAHDMIVEARQGTDCGGELWGEYRLERHEVVVDAEYRT